MRQRLSARAAALSLPSKPRVVRLTDRYGRFPLGQIKRRVTGKTVPFGRPPTPAARLESSSHPHACNICGWAGDTFIGADHCESNTCPWCGSIARDRFNFFVAFNATRTKLGSSVIETSPRLDDRYRRHMKRLYDFRTGDFDESCHKADIFLDLQKMDLPSATIDLFTTAHVLEHVPDTIAAAKELFRVVKPGGRAVVAVPLLTGRTIVPVDPEYHEDHTLVHWRFGWDLADILRSAGFATRIVVSAPFERLLRGQDHWDEEVSGEFDLESLLSIRPDVVSILNDHTADLLGIRPAYQFVAFACTKPR